MFYFEFEDQENQKPISQFKVNQAGEILSYFRESQLSVFLLLFYLGLQLLGHGPPLFEMAIWFRH